MRLAPWLFNESERPTQISYNYNRRVSFLSQPAAGAIPMERTGFPRKRFQGIIFLRFGPPDTGPPRHHAAARMTLKLSPIDNGRTSMIASRASLAIRLAAIASCAFTLAACGSLERGEFPWSQPSASSATPKPQSPPRETPRSGGEQRQIAVRPPPSPVTPPAAPLPQPGIKLVGLSQPETADVLGQPEQESDAAPAKVWRYRSRECVLDVYFYLDVQRNGFYALHYTAYGASGAQLAAAAASPEAERCVRQVHDERGQR